MFERRLRSLLLVFLVAMAAILIRLGELQILRADYYRDRAEQVLRSRPRSLPFVRGAIRDRLGHTLVRDEPSWHITLPFDVIAADATSDSAMIRTAARRWLRGTAPGRNPEQIDALFLSKLDDMWRDLALLLDSSAPQGAETLREVAREIHDRVSRIRAAVARRRGFDAPVAEEQDAHTVIPELDADLQIRAREVLRPYPWLSVEPTSHRRVVDDAEPMAHILGRMGRVSAADIESDPDADDPFACYLPDESVGVSGVEWLAESRLRGRRGRVTLDRDDDPIAGEDIVAQNGLDVALTVHGELQRRLFDLLADTVAEVPQSSGGAIVVLDVATREALALVSYPSFNPGRFDEDYATLRDDTERLPLRFRAVSSRYAPGSIVKPLVALAGLTAGIITTDSREDCTGYLFPEQTTRWRCWEIHGTSQRMAHGPVNLVEALRGSCNIYMYKLGQRLGTDRLCSAFDMVGVGRSSGIGLREENVGVNPTAEWMLTHKSTHPTASSARLFAIGQAEVSMTPVQVANLMATYASGRYRPVTLLHTDTSSPQWTLPGSSRDWRAIREAMFDVVNHPDGTATDFAKWENPRYALMGKTGSATANRWPTAFRLPYVDSTGREAVAVVKAGAASEAVERFARENPGATFDPDAVTVESRWPRIASPDGRDYAHAWFGGILQEIDSNGAPRWSAEPRVAFAVLVEFGGSGGRVSGPLARRVAETLVDVLGPELRADHSSPRPRNDGA